MKKWINTIFMGSCFILAILIEIYGILVWKGDMFSSVALGVVVLITGFLFMDSLRSKIEQGAKSAKFYVDHLLDEETEKWTERHTEMFNLQKASYTATKKNSAVLSEQFGAVLLRLEALEKSNAVALQKIIELQKKSLEGQKNALNLEINYNKENTKKILAYLQDEDKNKDLSEQLSKILTLLESNKESLSIQPIQETAYEENFLKAEDLDGLSEDFYDQLSTVDHIEEITAEEENASEADWPSMEVPELEAVNPIDEINEEEEEIQKVVPLYDDPNKALTAEEIASLFASFGQ